ncbi:MAG: hypothetical protein L0241_03700, partial [Planctomycetia bacterium]|nr:hypothetical protein [Planctomycetia bacterium]
DEIRKFEPDKVEEKTQEWIDKRAKDEKYMIAVRKRLIDYGIPEARLNRFPAAQIILLDEMREYEVRRDEAGKYMNLPTWEAMPALNKLQPPKEPALFDLFVPAVHKIRQAQGRLEQRIALLRHVEALRMYAAAHDGKFPEKLTDIDVPLPVDPFTGKPFRYELKGEVAHLRGTPPKGSEKIAAFNLHYEITIRK